MVRFKNRYIVFDIIYADTPLGLSSLPSAHALRNQPDIALEPFGDTGRHNLRTPALSQKDLIFAIKDSIAENFGDYGVGMTQRALTLKYFSPHTNVGILRVSREEANMVWGAMTFIRQIKGNPCLIKVIHVTGTIKMCQLKTIAYDRDRILYLRRQAQLMQDDEVASRLTQAIHESKSEIDAMEI
ncbi:hypothetical protein DFQ27_009441 [Actinomortierella ambigua]|uniref:Ribonuclease P/MRP protein subunit POP5 n=1 Tax=Actinomortierella ambigua TaxID=1343610 RepID=A0A9P6QEE0_9FUNG|nr:hypothetical protein DFQ26_002840 [Actinomortierella ambigua]KAG0266772.1 hypothetical protein DFQ27_009441 [Actinomortierella ambigua]